MPYDNEVINTYINILLLLQNDKTSREIQKQNQELHLYISQMLFTFVICFKYQVKKERVETMSAFIDVGIISILINKYVTMIKL